MGNIWGGEGVSLDQHGISQRTDSRYTGVSVNEHGIGVPL